MMSPTPNVPHDAAQRYTPSHMVSSHCAPHLSYAICVAHGEGPISYWLNDERSCVERAEVLNATHFSEVRMRVNQDALHAGHRSAYARNDPLLSRHGWAEDDLGSLGTTPAASSSVPNVLRAAAQQHVSGGHTISPVHTPAYKPGTQMGVKQDAPHAGHRSAYIPNNPPLSRHGQVAGDLGSLSAGILHDALSIAPSVLPESVLYNKDWTEQDMMCFTQNLIEESYIACEWGTCSRHLRVKEIKNHLIYEHQIKSHTKPYNCLWNGCLSSEPMTQLSSLVRHIQENHGSAYKYWPCPTCERRYSRAETLLRHLQKCLGCAKPQVGPRRG